MTLPMQSKFVIIINALVVLILLLTPHCALGCKIEKKSLKKRKKKCKKWKKKSEMPADCVELCKKSTKPEKPGLGNGEEECEDQKFNENQCNAIGCCEWDRNKDKCWSAVEKDQCKPTDPGLGNGEVECEGQKLSKKQCKKVGCCNWNRNKCNSAVGTDECKSVEPDPEEPEKPEPCENQKKKKKCKKADCCKWKKKKCNSVVGTGVCKPTEPGEGSTHGGCIQIEKCTSCVKTPLKSISEIELLPEAGSSIRGMTVNGIQLVGASTEDTRWCWVATSITESLSDAVKVDPTKQSKVIKNLYEHKVVATLVVDGKKQELKGAFEDSNSVCDQIGIKEKSDASSQISEVLEHILHFIHIGERFTFPEWSIESVTSTDAWKAVKEAEEANVYDTSELGLGMKGDEKTRVILQEFHFWLVMADWNLLRDDEFKLGNNEWTRVNNLIDMKKILPKTFELYEKTTGKILSRPSDATLRSLGNLRKSGTLDECTMPTP